MSTDDGTREISLWHPILAAHAAVSAHVHMVDHFSRHLGQIDHLTSTVNPAVFENALTIRALFQSMRDSVRSRQSCPDDISPELVSAFLAGKGSLTASWHVKYNALSGFFRYAQSRGMASGSPLPKVIPKRPPAFQPYIYSPDELRHLFEAALSYQHNRGHLDPRTVRTILLLLYGAALRSSEALALTFADVDIDTAVLTVRVSKFFKSRLVPLGPSLTEQMRVYAEWRSANWHRQGEDAPFFCDRHGKPVNLNTLHYNFERLRAHAGLRRDGGPRCQPRMHDLLHTSAVHRLALCYRQNGNVQKYVERLSVYMGHAQLSGTQTYLSMTAKLLAEASSLFERYAVPGGRL